MEPCRPVIVCGAHRSGTSLLSEVLQASGIHMGADQESNRESMAFLRMNDWLLSLSGATWSSPGHGVRGLSTAELALVEDSLRQSLRGWVSIRYLGLKRLHSSIPSLSDWGWKDPRNTFTAEYWDRIFPAAKYVVVERHGVDVSASLFRRHQRRLSDARRASRSLSARALRHLRAKRGYFGGPTATATLDAAFNLWRAYFDAGREWSRQRPEAVHRVSYEGLVSDPGPVLGQLSDFLNHPRLMDVQFRQHQSPYAYRQDDQLLRWALTKRTDLEKRGFIP